MAIDPGNKKCGLAIVNEAGEVLRKMIIPSELIKDIAVKLLREYPVTSIVVGDRTCSRKICQDLADTGLPIKTVDENRSSFEGRFRYLKEHTRGLARLIPIGLRTPKEAYDDYVAVILAERFFSGGKKE